MRLSTRTVRRRALGALVAVATLGGTFSLGVVAGAGSRPDRENQARAGILDEAASDISGQGLHPVPRKDLDAAAIQAMLSAAGDPWGGWADTPAAGAPGGYVGVGLWLRRDGGLLKVAQVTAGSPAQHAGVQSGDELRAVGSASAAGRAPAQVAASLRGLPGTRVLVVLARGAAVRTLSLVRMPFPAAPVTVSAAAPGIGRITVPSFSRGTGRGVRTALAQLRARHDAGVVLDLRGDPGGLLAEAVEAASAFLRSGPVVTYTRRDGRPQRLDVLGSGDLRTPLVVLVDGGTASAAEVVAGALQDRSRAVVIGSRTFGKGTVQEPRELPDGSLLDLTVARYALPSGRSVEGVGLEPDIAVAAPVGPGGDPAVRRAVEVLTGLTADAGRGRG